MEGIEAYSVYNDPKSNGHQKAAALTKFSFNFALAVLPISPWIGLGVAILDASGVTDEIYNNLGTLYRTR